MQATVKIAGHRFFDLGSDRNWNENGGMWGRQLSSDDPDLWVAIRFDPNEDAETGCFARGFEFSLSDLDAGCLQSAGIPDDGLDEYGEPIPPARLAMMKAEAAVMYGVGGVHAVSAERTGHGSAAHVRATCARMLMGDYIEPSVRYPVRCE